MWVLGSSIGSSVHGWVYSDLAIATVQFNKLVKETVRSYYPGTKQETVQAILAECVNDNGTFTYVDGDVLIWLARAENR
jgi:predicted RNA-binding protein (virulence factor B family)